MLRVGERAVPLGVQVVERDALEIAARAHRVEQRRRRRRGAVHEDAVAALDLRDDLFRASPRSSSRLLWRHRRRHRTPFVRTPMQRAIRALAGRLLLSRARWRRSTGRSRSFGRWLRARFARGPQFVRASTPFVVMLALAAALGGCPGSPSSDDPDGRPGGRRRPGRRRTGGAAAVARRPGREARAAPSRGVDPLRQLRDERRVRAVSPRVDRHGAARRERQGHLAGGDVARVGDGARRARPVLSRERRRRARTAADTSRPTCRRPARDAMRPRRRSSSRPASTTPTFAMMTSEVSQAAHLAREGVACTLCHQNPGRGPRLADELHRRLHGGHRAADLRPVREPDHRPDAHHRELHADVRRADREERALRDVPHGDHASARRARLRRARVPRAGAVSRVARVVVLERRAARDQGGDVPGLPHARRRRVGRDDRVADRRVPRPGSRSESPSGATASRAATASSRSSPRPIRRGSACRSRRADHEAQASRHRGDGAHRRDASRSAA